MYVKGISVSTPHNTHNDVKKKIHRTQLLRFSNFSVKTDFIYLILQ